MNRSKKFLNLLLAISLLLGSSVLGFAQKKSASPTPHSEGKVNINTANADQLRTLPGIGPVTAQRVIEHRTKNGPFKKVEDLMSVKGIGQKRFSVLKDRITI